MGEVEERIRETRQACRHFAMLYFQFCRTLVEEFGEEVAFRIAQKSIFNLSLDRTDRIRDYALEEGIATGVEEFRQVNDLPYAAWKCWEPAMGGMRCPYAQQWVTYYDAFPWFRRFASMYCDVIDTTNIENFTRTHSHRITSNLLWGDPACDREYFESEEVKGGKFTYGSRPAEDVL